MFWKDNKGNTANKTVRNVRKNAWQPNSKPKLLDRANAAVSDQTKAYKKLKRKTADADLSRTNSEGLAFRKTDAPINHRLQSQSFPQNMPVEDSFSISVSDIVKPTIAPVTQDKAGDNHVLKEPNANTTTQHRFFFRWKHYLSLLALWVVLYGISGLIDPLAWQWSRTLYPLDTKSSVVLIEVDEAGIADMSEKDFFRGMVRLLKSDIRSVGFLEPPQHWQPNSDDVLSYERLSQTLSRYPRVVLGLQAVPRNIKNITTTNEKLVELEPVHFFHLPSNYFSALNPYQILPADERIYKLLPQVSVGFIDISATPERVSLNSWGTAALLSPWTNIYNKQNPNEAISSYLPSFAASLSMMATNYRPAQFRNGHALLNASVVAGNNNWNINETGSFAPFASAHSSSAKIMRWSDWVTSGKSAFLKDKIVIVGRNHMMVPSLLPIQVDGWFDKNAQGLWESVGNIVQKRGTLSLPTVGAPHMSMLHWQGLLVDNLLQGQTKAVPDFYQQTLASFVVLLIVLVVAMMWQRAVLPMLFTFAMLAGGLSLSSSFALTGAAIAALLLAPLAWFAARPLSNYSIKNNKLEQNRTEKAGGQTTNRSSVLPLVDPINKTSNDNLNDGQNFQQEASKLQPSTIQSIDQYKDSFAAVDSVPPAKGFLKADLFSDRALSDQAQVVDDLRNEIKGESRTISPQPSATHHNEKLAWLLESERASQTPIYQARHNLHSETNVEEGSSTTQNQDWKINNGQAVARIVEEVIRPITDQLSSSLIGEPLSKPVLNDDTSTPPAASHAGVAKTPSLDTQGFNRIITDQFIPVADKPPPESRSTQSPSSSTEAVKADDLNMKIGRYEVEKVLGRGAMGVVYLGLDPHINRKVAIKTVPMPVEEVDGENQQLAAKFFREAQAAGKLTHPGIVTVYDAGLYKQNIYIAMEYLEGKDLSAYTHVDKRLPLATTLNVIARVAEALHFAHESGVVHRDIKPANIIFDSASNVVKVTDFGIAYIHDSNRVMTQVLVGSPNYMSPEHLTGETLDGRTDLFSLGVTLYVLASGSTPFAGDNVNRLMYTILNEAPRDIRQFNPEIPETVVAILHRALQKDRNYRYNSGASMAQDLKIALNILNKPS